MTGECKTSFQYLNSDNHLKFFKVLEKEISFKLELDIHQNLK